MDLEQVCKKFREIPTRLEKGKYTLAARWDTDLETIIKAKKIVKEELGNPTSKELREKAKKVAEELGAKKVQEYRSKKHKGVKILLFDIETAPMKAYIWGLWKQNIAWDHVTSDWFIICWAAKWLDSPDIYSGCVSPVEALNEDDSNILKPLWKLLDEADVVIGHNSDSFDIPRLNSRFVLNGMVPPSPYYKVDTWKVAKKEFAFTSNKLDALAHYFGLEGKYETDFKLWEGCLNGDRKCLQEMQDYNIQDVKVLEEVFYKLRPWIKGFPNANNYLQPTQIVCATCGSDNLEELPGQYYYTATGKYQLLRCKDCGAITKSRYNLNTPKNVRGTNVGR